MPWEQTILTRMCTGGAAEPEAPAACHFEAPLGSPQDSQPIFRHNSDLWHISFVQMAGTDIITLNDNCSFTCICCTFTCICFTLPTLISTWIIVTIIVTGAEVLTIFLYCEKNAVYTTSAENSKGGCGEAESFLA